MNNCKNFNRFYYDHDYDDYFSYDDVKTRSTAPVHLCFLKQNRTRSICHDLTNEFEKQKSSNSNVKLNCIYNFWNGEYEINMGHATAGGTQIKLVIHEFETKPQSNAQFNYWNLQNWWLYQSNRLDKSLLLKREESLNDIAKMNVGLIEYLLGTRVFQVPLYFFYNLESRKLQDYYYLNYMSAAFRLPSETIEYFMHFYSNLWYLS